LVIFWVVAGVTLVLWVLRGIGILAILPGFIFGSLLLATWLLLLVNGFIETR
jgi:hypothetical protein